MDCYLVLESDVVIFGEGGWGYCNVSLVFPFKLVEYRLQFSENMLKYICRNRSDAEKEACLYVPYKSNPQSGPDVL